MTMYFVSPHASLMFLLFARVKRTFSTTNPMNSHVMYQYPAHVEYHIHSTTLVSTEYNINFLSSDLALLACLYVSFIAAIVTADTSITIASVSGSPPSDLDNMPISKT